MSIADIILLAIALAMDCFTVSMASGVILGRWTGSVMARTALLFGVFQAGMPLLGWAVTNSLSSYVQAFDHWLAFGLLAFLGGKMIYGALSPGEQDKPALNPASIVTELILAIATSIDALAVGITFAATGYATLSSLFFPLATIGLASLLFSLLGFWLGIRYGAAVGHKMKPEVVGGVILIAIGLKILLSHLLTHT